MSNDTEYTEKAYTTSEIATMLDIAVPTVRKYAQSMERSGYVFIKTKGKGKHQSRLFIEKDVTALRYLKELRDKSNMNVDQASNVIITKFGKGAIQSVATNDIPQKSEYDKQYSELKEMIHKQNELIESLTKRLDQRDKLLIENLNKSLEKTQKQIASAEKEKGLINFAKNILKRLKG